MEAFLIIITLGGSEAGGCCRTQVRAPGRDLVKMLTCCVILPETHSLPEPHRHCLDSETDG